MSAINVPVLVEVSAPCETLLLDDGTTMKVPAYLAPLQKRTAYKRAMDIDGVLIAAKA